MIYIETNIEGISMIYIETNMTGISMTYIETNIKGEEEEKSAKTTNKRP